MCSKCGLDDCVCALNDALHELDTPTNEINVEGKPMLTIDDILSGMFCEEGEILSDWLIVGKLHGQDDTVSIVHAGNSGLDMISQLGLAQASMNHAMRKLNKVDADD